MAESNGNKFTRVTNPVTHFSVIIYVNGYRRNSVSTPYKQEAIDLLNFYKVYETDIDLDFYVCIYHKTGNQKLSSVFKQEAIDFLSNWEDPVSTYNDINVERTV